MDRHSLSQKGEHMPLLLTARRRDRHESFHKADQAEGSVCSSHCHDHALLDPYRRLSVTWVKPFSAASTLVDVNFHMGWAGLPKGMAEGAGNGLRGNLLPFELRDHIDLVLGCLLGDQLRSHQQSDSRRSWEAYAHAFLISSPNCRDKGYSPDTSS